MYVMYAIATASSYDYIYTHAIICMHGCMIYAAACMRGCAADRCDDTIRIHKIIILYIIINTRVSIGMGGSDLSYV